MQITILFKKCNQSENRPLIVLDEDQDSLIENNLFAYCLNDPIDFIDSDGRMATATRRMVKWGALGLGALVVLGLFLPEIASTVLLASVAGAALGCGVYLIYNGVKTARYNPDPYARPGQKKQNRELKNKNRSKQGYKPRNNKRDGKPAKPKKHTPSRKGHKKY